MTAIASIGLAGAAIVSAEANDDEMEGEFQATLRGFQEVPSISTLCKGTFDAHVGDDKESLEYQLTYSTLEGGATAAHIHFAQRHVNGGVSAFLCGGDGKPDRPADGKLAGTLTADDLIGPADQGITAGEFSEVVRAMKSGATYINVHTDIFPSGEIRGQATEE